MLGDTPGDHRITVGGDKGYDTREFVKQCRELKITPHLAQNTERRGGWAKQYGGLRRMMYRGRKRVSARVTFTMAVYNLLRISHLVPEPVG